MALSTERALMYTPTKTSILVGGCLARNMVKALINTAKQAHN